MNYELLKELASIHSISGDERLIENYIGNIAKENNLPFEINPGYGIVIGNPKANTYCIAHIDEVGGIISHKKGNTFKFKGVGRVKPSIFIGRTIEIKNEKGEIIEGLVVGNIPLKTNYKRFGDLRIVIDEKDSTKVKKGDFFRLKFYFSEKENSVFSSALDNRVGVFSLLKYILDNKKKKSLFENIAFCFATEEELKNKGALFYMKNFSPKNILIFDVYPESFLKKNDYAPHTYIVKSTPDYELKKYYLEILKSFNNFSYTSSKSTLMKNSEPYQYEKVSNGNAINILCPLFNYHSGIYFIEKKAIKNYYHFMQDIIGKFY